MGQWDRLELTGAQAKEVILAALELRETVEIRWSTSSKFLI